MNTRRPACPRFELQSWRLVVSDEACQYLCQHLRLAGERRPEGRLVIGTDNSKSVRSRAILEATEPDTRLDVTIGTSTHPRGHTASTRAHPDCQDRIRPTGPQRSLHNHARHNKEHR